ncbi:MULTISPECIES: hypothetical protein [Niastella]|uniref:Leucine-rich repeat domain-containing protein n=1 Tax=Niastella soli TaxID=2821487 RepID=A0ABS3Z190_9BACT|nr:hypothetical protein [Niastella soli]MBO9203915.1 hypothetical protein [Niastella soli]
MKQRIWSLSQFLVVILLMTGLLIQSCSKKVGDSNPVDDTPVETETMRLIPDSMLRVYLKANICPNAFDKTGKLIDITSPEVKNFAGTMTIDTLTCPNPFVHSLKGIEYFSKMSKLIVKNCPVDSVNLRATMALDTIKLLTNKDLQYVNVKGCTSMRFLRAAAIPITTLDLSNLTALNYVNLISLTRLSTLKTDNDANLRHLMTFGMSSLKTVNVSTNTELRRLYLEECKVVNTLDITKNRKLDQLVATYCAPLKSVDLSKSDSLRIISLEGCGVDTVDFSHNPELLSVVLMWTPVRNLDMNANPKLRLLWLDGTTQLKTLDIRTQTNWDYYFYTSKALNYMSDDDAYMVYQQGRISPIRTDVYNTEAKASRKDLGDAENLYAGLRVPQYLDANGLTLKQIKINVAAKNNYSLVMSRRTGGLVTPPQVTVYAADKTTVDCNDYDPLTFKCN